MQYCQFCGAGAPNDSRFCGYCGHTLTDIAKDAVDTTRPTEPGRLPPNPPSILSNTPPTPFYAHHQPHSTASSHPASQVHGLAASFMVWKPAIWILGLGTR